MLTGEQIVVSIQLLEGYLNGQTIQRRGTKNKFDTWQDYDFQDTQVFFDFENFHYRIKPEQIILPYKRPEEVLEAIKTHGHYIKDGNTYRFIKKFTVMENDDIVYSLSGWSATNVRTWEEIHDKIQWADGAPFGKVIK